MTEEEEGKKVELKAGDIVGYAPDVTIAAFDRTHRKEVAAWLELERIIKERNRLWDQLIRDNDIPESYFYDIKHDTREIVVVRRQ